MKCKCFMEGSLKIQVEFFLTFRSFLSKYKFLDVAIFLPLMKHFFSSLQPLPGKVKKCLFPVSLLNIDTNSLNTNTQFINPNYA